jgi:hypothetical protein
MDNILFQDRHVVVTYSLIKIGGRTLPVNKVNSVRILSYSELGSGAKNYYLKFSLSLIFVALVCVITGGGGAGNSTWAMVGGLIAIVSGFLGVSSFAGWLIAAFFGAAFGRRGNFLTMEISSGRPVAIEGLSEEALNRARLAIETAMGSVGN